MIAKDNRKNVIYTCITDGYDMLINHTYVDDNWDYVCFTDDLSISSVGNSSWHIRPLHFAKCDNIRNQRWHKIHPHILFPEYQSSVWLDGNVNILDRHIFTDFDKAINEHRLASIAPHPERNCVYDEFIACVELGKDDERILNKQLSLIKKFGYPKRNGLFETNVIYRDHHNYRISEVMKDWWWWIENYSRRDQLSLPYVLW
jgi:hypothetical protein